MTRAPRQHRRGVPGRPVTGLFPGSGSTRSRITPAPIPAPCGRSNGTLLATGTFTNESSQGWQELDFSTPVAVTAGTTYVASYHTSTGHYADTTGGLASAVTNGPLTALANGGVYAYGSANTFPTNTYQDDNFWVDVVFSPSRASGAVGDECHAGERLDKQPGFDCAHGDVL